MEVSVSEEGDEDDQFSMIQDEKSVRLKIEPDDNDDTLTFPKITKSGRAIHKPTQFVPTIASPSTTNPKGHRKKRTQSKKQANPEAALCKLCDRGHSPENNQIVFCDGCGNAFHQFCHNPPIDRLTVIITEKEWFCTNCMMKRERKGMTSIGSDTLGSGEKLSLEERRTYLSSLDRGKLLDLLLHATTLHPSLPIFPSSITMASITKAKSQTSISNRPITSTPRQSLDPTTTTPSITIKLNGTYNTNPSTESLHPNPSPLPSLVSTSQSQIPPLDSIDPSITQDQTEEYTEDEDELPLNYPHPGNGLAKHFLHPEADDEKWLIDDGSFGVFSHSFPIFGLGAGKEGGFGGEGGIVEDEAVSGAEIDVEMGGFMF